MVDDRMPPITTVANGRCTSAPVPVARAIGGGQLMPCGRQRGVIVVRQALGIGQRQRRLAGRAGGAGQYRIGVRQDGRGLQ